MMLVTSFAQPSNVDRSTLLQLGYLLTQSAPAALLQNLVFGFRHGWFLSTAGCSRHLCGDIGSGSCSVERSQIRCPITLTAEATGWSLNSTDIFNVGKGAVLFR